MLTWHGDVAQGSDTAQGQQSLGDVFHMFHVVKTDAGNVMGCWAVV